MDKGLNATEIRVGCDPRQGQLSVADLEALELLRGDLAAGRDWYAALLQAMALWGSRREVVEGREYLYLIADEAFDWLALAERLLLAADGQVPKAERDALLRRGQPPRALPEAEFRRLLGPAKYRAYLNYFYGVTVEQALQQAVAGEARKERRCRGLVGNRGLSREAFRRIYGEEQEALVAQFRQEQGRAGGPSFTPTQRKALLYWLFKYRLAHCDQARVASDTKKGLRHLERSGWRGPVAGAAEVEPALRRGPGPGPA